MAKKIYVGNLSFQTTETDLSDMFGEIGQLESVKIITDRDTGRSTGFGFIEMSDDAAASRAIEQFNGKQVNGFRVPQEPGSSGFDARMLLWNQILAAQPYSSSPRIRWAYSNRVLAPLLAVVGPKFVAIYIKDVLHATLSDA